MLLNVVSPQSRGTEVVRGATAGRIVNVAVGSSVTFYTTFPYRLRRPGVYRFNVSYGNVDSNIVTYTI